MKWSEILKSYPVSSFSNPSVFFFSRSKLLSTNGMNSLSCFNCSFPSTDFEKKNKQSYFFLSRHLFVFLKNVIFLEFPLWCSKLRICCYLYAAVGLICLVQWVKDLVLLCPLCSSLLQLELDPWPGHFHMPGDCLKKYIYFILYISIFIHTLHHIPYMLDRHVYICYTYLHNIYVYLYRHIYFLWVHES